MQGWPCGAKLALVQWAFRSVQSAEVVYLDAVTTYCYQRLMVESDCCRDRTPSSGILNVSLSRPHTSWVCATLAQGGQCLDQGRGHRGVDQLWWPAGADCTAPRILYVHGGNWMRHGPVQASYDVFASKLSKETGSLVMVPDYPLVPIGNSSGILRSLLAAWRWLAGHGPGGKDCSAVPRPPRFVAGDSSGGGTGLSLLLNLHTMSTAHHEAAAGFLGFSPWTNLACDTPTYYTNTFAQLADLDGMTDYVGDILARGLPRNKTVAFQRISRAYVLGMDGSSETKKKQRLLLADPEASPFHAADTKLRSLPPLYLAVSGTESMAGDGVILGGRVARQGVPVVLDVFHGMWHAFPLYTEGCGSGHELWQGKAALRHAGDFVRQVAREANERGYGHAEAAQLGGNAPQVHIYYVYPTWHAPWVPVRPLSPSVLRPPQEGSGDTRSWAARRPHPAPATHRLSSRVDGRAHRQHTHGRQQLQAPNEASPVVAARVRNSGRHGCKEETLAGAYLTGAAGGAMCTALAVVGTWWYCSDRHGLCVQAAER
mmetsp:Transcript_13596/g.31992  ORF Transcript_13596/g.31992 Transcript_13596/m.31992 type:complete len:542 (-) Transcript_13596:37-1662(-)